MNKKVTFLLSFLLVITIFVGMTTFPASSYENEVNPTSKAILLLNLDTDTVVYSRNTDTVWYTAELGEVMTFIIAAQNIKDVDDTRVDVTQEFLDSLRYSDGCLKKYVGKSLSARDLLAIMMLSKGSDAAFLLADIVSPGDVDTFIGLMNRKATELGCTKTKFITPGYAISDRQLTTCNDMAKIYRCAMRYDVFNEIVKSSTYLPEGYDKKKFTLTTNNSMMVGSSPYYFRYVTGGKFSYNKAIGENFVATTVYYRKTYLFVALKGSHTAEQNTFVDAKRLTTWAYLYLSDKRLIPARTTLGTTSCSYPWGDSEISLIVEDAALRTVPNAYDEAKFKIKPNVPDSVSLPVFEGQNLGTAGVYYKKEKLDEVDLVAERSKGVSMLSDLSDYLGSALDSLFPIEPQTEELTETETEPATETPTKAEKATKQAQPATKTNESTAATE